jgi:IS5 family transposase
MGVDVFEQLHQAIINQLERRTQSADPTTNTANASSELTEPTSVTDMSTETTVDSAESNVINDEKQQSITHQGRLLLDATVAEQTIRFPNDLGLLE